jgi:hypothetical protein
MIYPFDIFQTETGGSVRWLEAAETLEAAKARVQELALQSPGEYMILCQKTGNKLVIDPDAVDLAPGSKDSRFPIWEKPYQDALKEAAPERRAEKVTAAETAIFRRLPELVSSSDGNSEIYERLQAMAHDSSDESERQVVADAMSTLRILQRRTTIVS